MDPRDIIARIDKLYPKEKRHILNILKQYTNDYTKNENGYFFNLARIDEEVIEKISKCLELIEKNIDLIHEMDRRRSELLAYYKNIIEEKLVMTIREKKDQYMKTIYKQPQNTNIILEIKRINVVKRKRLYEDIIDPDDKIKEYNSSLTKFVKDTVYWRLFAKSKALKTNRNINNNIRERDDGDYICDVEGKEDDLDGDINLDDTGDVLDDEVDDIDIGDVDIDEEFETHEDVDDAEVDVDVECDGDLNIEIEETEGDTESVEIQKMISKTNTDSDLAFYKRLLNLQGFAFEDDSVYELVYQSYIN